MEWKSPEVVNDLLEYFSDYLSLDEDENREEYLELKEEIEDSIENGVGYARFEDWGDSISIKVDGEEFNLISNEDEARRIALEIVTEQCQSEPELFNRDFLQNYLIISDTDRRIISNEEADHYYDEQSDDEIEEAYERDFVIDEDTEGKDVEDKREELKYEYSKRIEDELKDPIQYFVHDQGIYSVEDLMKASFIMIDHEEMAEDAIQADGWPHFISHYDGDYKETNSGIILMKE